MIGCVTLSSGDVKIMLRDILKSRVVWTALALVAAYWIAAFFVKSTILIPALNFVLIAVAIAVMFAYAPSILDALRRNNIDRVTQLTIGIVLAWIAAIMLRSWAAAIRITDYDWMRDSPFVGFCIYLTILAGVLHLTPPGAIDGRIPRRNWVILGIAVGAGLLAAGILLVLRIEDLFQTG